MSVIDLSTIHRVGKVNVSRPNVFGIVTLPRTYYVQGTSEEEVDNWIKSINELIKVNGGGGSNNINHRTRKLSLSENQNNKVHPKENSGEMVNNKPVNQSHESLENNSVNGSNHSLSGNNNDSKISNNGDKKEMNSNVNTPNVNSDNNNTKEENNNPNHNNNDDNNDNIKSTNTTNNNTTNTTNDNNLDTNTITNNPNNESLTKKKDNKPMPILTTLNDMDVNGSAKVKFIQSASVVENRSANSAFSYSLSKSGKSTGRYNEIKSARPFDENYPMIREDEGSSSEENLFIANPLTSVNLLNDNVVVRQGYLLRQSSKYKTWKKRWFVLRNGKLTCYKNEKEYVVISIIPLSETLDIIETEKPVNKSHKYCFKIITEGKTMILCSDTEEDCNNWINDLQRYHKVIQEIKEKNGLVE
ncbi:hypothetical protein PIROE2DRAFT_61239 [Piromyces sp. E2]|nr:hypothetical protein PIROE2DRAFT_61239 [Piromyces sp. E2]|eukprot:OUM63516.1 hypothetical protein PIROE2DRAFT_61239 [Piromyces sp. E2]